jgi:hypothetical protein
MGTPALFSPAFFFAGLSALTRCDFKNPARWAGLLCRRGSALVATATGPRTGTGTTNAKGVRTAKGRVGELASLPCLLRPMHNNPTGVAPAGAI